MRWRLTKVGTAVIVVAFVVDRALWWCFRTEGCWGSERATQLWNGLFYRPYGENALLDEVRTHWICRRALLWRGE